MSQTPASDAEALGRYLDPKVLARVQRLDLRTRLVVEGFMTGLHRSPYQGLSVEFAQHREYVPGDDTRHIDWKVYSRTDRYYVKQYEEETNLRCTFLVDVSESMKYAGASRSGEGLSKYHYAACLAASMAMLLLRQQDAAGLVTFDESIVASVPPSASPASIKRIVHELERAEGLLTAKTRIDEVCAAVAERTARRGMICLVSDLLVEDNEALERGLAKLAHRGHDVMVINVLDEEELEFPFEGNTRFLGLEGMGDVTVEPRALRQGYLEALERFIADVRRRCMAHRIDYTTVSTADPLGAALGRFLAARAELGRKGARKHR